MQKYKYEKSHLTLGAAFMVIALIFFSCMLVGIGDIVNAQVNGVKTEAKIADINVYEVRHDGKSRTVHDVYVTYEVDGQGYYEKLGYYVIGMYVGKTIEVSYDPKAPSMLLSASVVPVIAVIPFMLMFGAVGFIIIKKEVDKGKYIKSLMAQDKYVVVTEDGVEKMSGLTVNNVRYRCMHFKYTDKATGEEYEFVSNPYHPDKCPFVIGMPVKVYVDLHLNPSLHFVCDEY